MEHVVRAFPILPGMEEGLAAFVRELRARSEETSEFYDGYGVKSSTWYLQREPQGVILIVVTEVVAARPFATSYGASERGFDRWYKDSVLRLSGIDLDRQPLGPVTEEVFAWRAS